MDANEAMKLALEAMGLIGADLVCEAAHHEKADRHGIGEPCPIQARWHHAFATLQEALAEQPAQQDSTCSNALRAQGKAYPRTCKKCGFGPYIELAQQALDKKAENARELGLDYEPAQQEPVARQYQSRDGVWKDFISEKHYKDTLEDGSWPIRNLYTSLPAQRTWVGLSDEEIEKCYETTGHYQTLRPQDRFAVFALAQAIEAKLKEKNT